jgi:hypothetical protein
MRRLKMQEQTEESCQSGEIVVEIATDYDCRCCSDCFDCYLNFDAFSCLCCDCCFCCEICVRAVRGSCFCCGFSICPDVFFALMVTLIGFSNGIVLNDEENLPNEMKRK